MNALIWLSVALMLAAMLVLCYALLVVASDADNQMETVMQERSSKAVKELVVRYPVPLDDALQQYVLDQASDKGISAAVVFAVIARESNFDADLIGDDGKSYGLMQIYASQHTERCIRLNAYNLLNPYQNVSVGIDYLAELLDTNKGLEWALMAYNGGPDYADRMTEAGKVSDYAVDVARMAECFFEGLQVVER